MNHEQKKNLQHELRRSERTHCGQSSEFSDSEESSANADKQSNALVESVFTE